MGGQLIRYDPIHLPEINEALNNLNHVGWIQYFRIIQGSYREIALEFMQNLDTKMTMVNIIHIQVNGEDIAKITRIAVEGEKRYELHTSLQNVGLLFIAHREELVKNGKGYNPNSFSKSWKDMGHIIQTYITFDGRFNVIQVRPLKLLEYLR